MYGDLCPGIGSKSRTTQAQQETSSGCQPSPQSLTLHSPPSTATLPHPSASLPMNTKLDGGIQTKSSREEAVSIRSQLLVSPIFYLKCPGFVMSWGKVNMSVTSLWKLCLLLKRSYFCIRTHTPRTFNPLTFTPCLLPFRTFTPQDFYPLGPLPSRIFTP